VGRVLSRVSETSGVQTPWDERKAKPVGSISLDPVGPRAVVDPVHASISLCTRIGRSSVRAPGDGWAVRAVNPMGAMRQ
jgi:hypothetical protein